MSHYSITDSIEWRVDYSSQDAVPGLRWDALDASAAVLVARVNGEEVLSVTDDHEWVEVGSELTLTIPGDTLPQPGVYKLQAVVTLDDGTTATVPSEPDLIRVTESLVEE